MRGHNVTTCEIASSCRVCMGKRKECAVPGLLDVPLVVKYWTAIKKNRLETYERYEIFPNFERMSFYSASLLNCFGCFRDIRMLSSPRLTECQEQQG